MGRITREKVIIGLDVAERINRNITGNTNGFNVTKVLDELGKSLCYIQKENNLKGARAGSDTRKNKILVEGEFVLTILQRNGSFRGSV